MRRWNASKEIKRKMVEKLGILVRNSCLERTGKELIEIVFTLHSSLANALFIGGCEGWVKSEDYFMTPLFIQISKSRIHGVGLCFLTLIAGFTMPCGQPTGRYGDSCLFYVRQ